MTPLEYKNDILRRARRVVVKVGSQILSSREGIEESRLRGLVRELADLHSAKKQLVIVSSGAVAAGMTTIGLCAASHIRDGHDAVLRDAGAVHLANSWAEVERLALRFFKA